MAIVVADISIPALVYWRKNRWDFCWHETRREAQQKASDLLDIEEFESTIGWMFLDNFGFIISPSSILQPLQMPEETEWLQKNYLSLKFVAVRRLGALI